jgi:hypothetical protein
MYIRSIRLGFFETDKPGGIRSVFAFRKIEQKTFPPGMAISCVTNTDRAIDDRVVSANLIMINPAPLHRLSKRVLC